MIVARNTYIYTVSFKKYIYFKKQVNANIMMVCFKTNSVFEIDHTVSKD